MSEMIMSVEGTFSAEQVEQVKALLTSKRAVAEIDDELGRMLGAASSPQQRAKKTTCEDCKCGPWRTCTDWVWVNGKWVPTGVHLESCGWIDRFFGCWNSIFGA